MNVILKFTAALLLLTSIGGKAMEASISRDDGANSQIINQEAVYQEALRFRDNKMQGFSVNQSEREAKLRFLSLARLGHAKAMHNYAMILNKNGDYLEAYT